MFCFLRLYPACCHTAFTIPSGTGRNFAIKLPLIPSVPYLGDHRVAQNQAKVSTVRVQRLHRPQRKGRDGGKGVQSPARVHVLSFQPAGLQQSQRQGRLLRPGSRDPYISGSRFHSSLNFSRFLFTFMIGM